uniref:Transmembrane protein 241 isoform X2 n=1 Tax=Geotrypetes seraphini TaxID=260995 RepID=A0A6P8Q0N4_GEOSA|nr:transmembrane protein 241 isoform X2 [Geotrypetes seraphini]
MFLNRLAVGLVFCLFHLTAYFTNKYVLSVLKFTYPTLFQGSQVLSWLPASVLFVGNIYAGSRALSKLPIPVFFTLQNAAEVVSCGLQSFIQKEHISLIKICSLLFLLIAAICLPLHDSQFDPDGYFWAVVHLSCVGGYKSFQKSHKSTVLSDLDQQYINYIFSIVLLSVASHPTGDLFDVMKFPFLYLYRFHSGCCASGILGFFLMLFTVKLKSSQSSRHLAAWTLFAKVITAGASLFFFNMILNIPTACCILLGGLGESLLVFSEKTGI